MNRDAALFREVQRWRGVWWVMALVIGLAALQWWIFLGQIVGGVPMGNNPAPHAVLFVFWLIFGIGFPLFFWWLRLVIEVWPEGVVVHYRPFVHRRIAIGQIVRAEPRVYRPLTEFGGWGIRGWGGRIAYNVSGKMGVELTLIDGRRVLLGTQRAPELAAAIYKAWGGTKYGN
jgi:hypothetical protein